MRRAVKESAVKKLFSINLKARESIKILQRIRLSAFLRINNLLESSRIVYSSSPKPNLEVQPPNYARTVHWHWLKNLTERDIMSYLYEARADIHKNSRRAGAQPEKY